MALVIFLCFLLLPLHSRAEEHVKSLPKAQYDLYFFYQDFVEAYNSLGHRDADSTAFRRMLDRWRPVLGSIHSADSAGDKCELDIAIRIDTIAEPHARYVLDSLVGTNQLAMSDLCYNGSTVTASACVLRLPELARLDFVTSIRSYSGGVASGRVSARERSSKVSDSTLSSIPFEALDSKKKP